MSEKRGQHFKEETFFKRMVEGRRAYSLPDVGVDLELPDHPLVEKNPETPKGASESEVVRHFTRLSTWNFAIDLGMYPLGSCTMKYNPKFNEEIAALSGFQNCHPYTPASHAQGALEVIWTLQNILGEIVGLPGVSLQPAAGAQGEYAGIKIIKAYQSMQAKEKGLEGGSLKNKILIPDSAHGTNPASCALEGFSVVKVPSSPEGIVDPATLKELVDENTAGMMITNPNTLGIFERGIGEICEIIHGVGGLVYCDGANLNAMMGLTRPGDQGVDIMHMNLHKTFSTPHGGGGPGSGPVAVTKELAKYLPGPVVSPDSSSTDRKFTLHTPENSIGRVRAGFGNFGVLVRALNYILTMGDDGLREASEVAIANANYIRTKLKDRYNIAYDQPCMHEVVFNDKNQSQNGVKTLDIAKRLIDYGFHPPTMYFPLIVKNALMIEPTETESQQELDRFVDAMLAIDKECEENPDLVKTAPHTTPVSRVDEVYAAKNLCLKEDF